MGRPDLSKILAGRSRRTRRTGSEKGKSVTPKKSKLDGRGVLYYRVKDSASNPFGTSDATVETVRLIGLPKLVKDKFVADKASEEQSFSSISDIARKLTRTLSNDNVPYLKVQDLSNPSKIALAITRFYSEHVRPQDAKSPLDERIANKLLFTYQLTKDEAENIKGKINKSKGVIRKNIKLTGKFKRALLTGYWHGKKLGKMQAELIKKRVMLMAESKRIAIHEAYIASGGEIDHKTTPIDINEAFLSRLDEVLAESSKVLKPTQESLKQAGITELFNVAEIDKPLDFAREHPLATLKIKLWQAEKGSGRIGYVPTSVSDLLTIDDLVMLQRSLLPDRIVSESSISKKYRAKAWQTLKQAGFVDADGVGVIQNKFDGNESNFLKGFNPHGLTLTQRKEVFKLLNKTTANKLYFRYFHRPINADEKAKLTELKGKCIKGSVELALLEKLLLMPMMPSDPKKRVALQTTNGDKHSQSDYLTALSNLIKNNPSYAGLLKELKQSYYADAIASTDSARAIKALIVYMKKKGVKQLTPSIFSNNRFVSSPQEKAVLDRGLGVITTEAMGARIGFNPKSPKSYEENVVFRLVKEIGTEAMLVLASGSKPTQGLMGINNVENWRLMLLKKMYWGPAKWKQFKNLESKLKIQIESTTKKIEELRGKVKKNKKVSKKLIKALIPQVREYYYLKGRLDNLFRRLFIVDRDFFNWLAANFAKSKEYGVGSKLIDSYNESELQASVKDPFTGRPIHLGEVSSIVSNAVKDPTLQKELDLGWLSLDPTKGSASSRRVKMATALLIQYTQLEDNKLAESSPENRHILMGMQGQVGITPVAHYGASIKSDLLFLFKGQPQIQAQILSKMEDPDRFDQEMGSVLVKAIKLISPQGEKDLFLTHGVMNGKEAAGNTDSGFNKVPAKLGASGIIVSSETLDDDRVKAVNSAYYYLGQLLQGKKVNGGAATKGSKAKNPHGSFWRRAADFATGGMYSQLSQIKYSPSKNGSAAETHVSKWGRKTAAEVFGGPEVDSVGGVAGLIHYGVSGVLSTGYELVHTQFRFGVYMGIMFGGVLPTQFVVQAVNAVRGKITMAIDPSSGRPLIDEKTGCPVYHKAGIMDVVKSGGMLYAMLQVFRNCPFMLYGWLGVGEDIENGQIMSALIKIWISNFYLLSPGNNGFWDSTWGKFISVDRVGWKFGWRMWNGMKDVIRAAQIRNGHSPVDLEGVPLGRVVKLINKYGTFSNFVAQFPDKGIAGAVAELIGDSQVWQNWVLRKLSKKMEKGKLIGKLGKYPRLEKLAFALKKLGWSGAQTGLKTGINPIGTLFNLVGQSANESEAGFKASKILNTAMRLPTMQLNLFYQLWIRGVGGAMTGGLLRARDEGRVGKKGYVYNNPTLNPAMNETTVKVGSDGTFDARLLPKNIPHDVVERMTKVGNLARRVKILVQTGEGSSLSASAALAARGLNQKYRGPNAQGDSAVKAYDLTVNKVSFDSIVAITSGEAITIIPRAPQGVALDAASMVGAEIHINTDLLPFVDDVDRELKATLEKLANQPLQDGKYVVEEPVLNTAKFVELLRAKGITVSGEQQFAAQFKEVPLTREMALSLVRILNKKGKTSINLNYLQSSEATKAIRETMRETHKPKMMEAKVVDGYVYEVCGNDYAVVMKSAVEGIFGSNDQSWKPLFSEYSNDRVQKLMFNPNFEARLEASNIDEGKKDQLRQLIKEGKFDGNYRAGLLAGEHVWTMGDSATDSRKQYGLTDEGRELIALHVRAEQAKKGLSSTPALEASVLGKVEAYLEGQRFVREAMDFQESNLRESSGVSDKDLSSRMTTLWEVAQSGKLSHKQLVEATALYKEVVWRKAKVGGQPKIVNLTHAQLMAGYMGSLATDKAPVWVDLGTGEGKSFAIGLDNFLSLLQGKRVVITSSQCDAFAYENYVETRGVLKFLEVETEFIDRHQNSDSLKRWAYADKGDKRVVFASFDQPRFEQLFSIHPDSQKKPTMVPDARYLKFSIDESDHGAWDMRQNPAIVSSGSDAKAADADQVKLAERLVGDWIADGTLSAEARRAKESGRGWVANENDRGRIGFTRHGVAELERRAGGKLDPNLFNHLQAALRVHKFMVEGTDFEVVRSRAGNSKTWLLSKIGLADLGQRYIHRDPNSGRLNRGMQFELADHKATQAMLGFIITDPGVSPVSITVPEHCKGATVAGFSGTEAPIAVARAQEGGFPISIESAFKRTRIDYQGIVFNDKKSQVKAVIGQAITDAKEGASLVHAATKERAKESSRGQKLSIQEVYEGLKEKLGPNGEGCEIKEAKDGKSFVATKNGADPITVRQLSDEGDLSKEKGIAKKIGEKGSITITDIANRALNPGLVKAYDDAGKRESKVMIRSIATEWKQSIRHFLQEINRAGRPAPDLGRRAPAEMRAIYSIEDPGFDTRMKTYLKFELLSNDKNPVIILPAEYPDMPIKELKVVAKSQVEYLGKMEAIKPAQVSDCLRAIDGANSIDGVRAVMRKIGQGTTDVVMDYWKSTEEKALAENMRNNGSRGKAETLFVETLGSLNLLLLEENTKPELLKKVFGKSLKEACKTLMAAPGKNGKARISDHSGKDGWDIAGFQEVVRERLGLEILINSDRIESAEEIIEQVDKQIDKLMDDAELSGHTKKKLISSVRERIGELMFWLEACRRDIKQDPNYEMRESHIQDVLVKQFHLAVAEGDRVGRVNTKKVQHPTNGLVEDRLSVRIFGKRIGTTWALGIDGRTISVEGEPLPMTKEGRITEVERQLKYKLKTLVQNNGHLPDGAQASKVELHGEEPFSLAIRKGVRRLNQFLEQNGSKKRIFFNEFNGTYIFGEVEVVEHPDTGERRITFVTEEVISDSIKDRAMAFIPEKTSSHFGESDMYETILRKPAQEEFYKEMSKVAFREGTAEIAEVRFAKELFKLLGIKSLADAETASKKDRAIRLFLSVVASHESGHANMYSNSLLTGVSSKYRSLPPLAFELYESLADLEALRDVHDTAMDVNPSAHSLENSKIKLLAQLYYFSTHRADGILTPKLIDILEGCKDPDGEINFRKLHRTINELHNLFESTLVKVYHNMIDDTAKAQDKIDFRGDMQSELEVELDRIKSGKAKAPETARVVPPPIPADAARSPESGNSRPNVVPPPVPADALQPRGIDLFRRELSKRGVEFFDVQRGLDWESIDRNWVLSQVQKAKPGEKLMVVVARDRNGAIVVNSADMTGMQVRNNNGLYGFYDPRSGEIAWDYALDQNGRFTAGPACGGHNPIADPDKAARLEGFRQQLAGSMKSITQKVVIVKGLEGQERDAVIKAADSDAIIKYESTQKIKIKVRAAQLKVYKETLELANKIFEGKETGLTHTQEEAIIKRGTKVAEKIIKRAQAMNPDCDPELVKDAVLRAVADNVDLEIKGTTEISTPLEVREGKKLEIELALKIKSPHIVTMNGEQKTVFVLNGDIQTLLNHKVGTLEHVGARGRIAEQLKAQGVTEVNLETEVDRTFKMAKVALISTAGQAFFSNYVNELGIRILEREIAKIDPNISADEFKIQRKKAVETATKEMAAVGQKSYEALLKKATKGDIVELPLSEVEKTFEAIAKKSEVDISYMSPEEKEADIRETAERVNQELARLGNPEGIMARLEAAHHGTPTGGFGAKALGVGLSAGKGALMGLLVGGGMEAAKAFIKAPEGKGLEALWHAAKEKSVEHAYGFIQFELMNSSARAFLGLGGIGSSVVALGIPQIWALSQTPSSERGKALVSGTANLGAFFLASIATGKLFQHMPGLKRVAAYQVSREIAGKTRVLRMGGPIVGALALTAGLLAGEEVATFVNDKMAESVAWRNTLDNSVMRYLGNVLGDSSDLLTAQWGVSLGGSVANKFAQSLLTKGVSRGLITAGRASLLSRGSTIVGKAGGPLLVLAGVNVGFNAYYHLNYAGYQKTISERIGKSLWNGFYDDTEAMNWFVKTIGGKFKYAQMVEYVAEHYSPYPVTKEGKISQALVNQTAKVMGQDFNDSLKLGKIFFGHNNNIALKQVYDNPSWMAQSEETAYNAGFVKLVSSLHGLTEEIMLSTKEQAVYAAATTFIESVRDVEEITSYEDSAVLASLVRNGHCSSKQEARKIIKRVQISMQQQQVKQILLVNPKEMGKHLYGIVSYGVRDAKGTDNFKSFKGTGIMELDRVESQRDMLARYFDENGKLRADKVQELARKILDKKTDGKNFRQRIREHRRNYPQVRATQLIAAKDTINRMFELEKMSVLKPRKSDIKRGLVVRHNSGFGYKINQNSPYYQAWYRAAGVGINSVNHIAPKAENINLVLAELATKQDRSFGLISDDGQININNKYVVAFYNKVNKDVEVRVAKQNRKIKLAYGKTERRVKYWQKKFIAFNKKCIAIRLRFKKHGKAIPANVSKAIAKRKTKYIKNLQRATKQFAKLRNQKYGSKMQLLGLKIEWHKASDPIKKQLLAAQIRGLGGKTEKVNEAYVLRAARMLRALKSKSLRKQPQKYMALVKHAARFAM